MLSTFQINQRNQKVNSVGQTPKRFLSGSQALAQRAKGRNSPLWPPARRASGLEGKEGLACLPDRQGEIFRTYVFSIMDSSVRGSL